MSTISARGPRISFGVIVLNGEPFTAYTIRALYSHAHQIIVVEGASPGAHIIATTAGHSSDATLETLRRFKAEEDTEDKLTIVTAEDEGHSDGWWPGEKDEQSRAYAKRATGDYLWQVDIDESYTAEGFERVREMLRDDPSITGMSFRQRTFWGGLEYWCDGWYLRRGATFIPRVFKWGEGYEYITHRPATVVDEQGRDLRSLHWLTADGIQAPAILMYHYSLLFPKQVIEKSAYYAAVNWGSWPAANQWADEAFLRLGRPYRVHNEYNYPSWLERHHGDHPAEFRKMMVDLAASSPGSLRRTDDVERLLRTPWYGVGRAGLKALDPIDLRARTFSRRFMRRARRFFGK